MGPRSSDNPTLPDIPADARFRQALAELLKGCEYAEMTGGNLWDFAVEIHLLRSFGLSDNDLRLLVQKRFVKHGREVTTERTDGRRFKPANNLAFAERTCFVLTPLGAAKVLSQSNQSMQHEFGQSKSISTPAEFHVPEWDATRRLLSYGGQTVKQFTRPAVNQELLLSAFEEEGWPARILDPLAPNTDQDFKRRLAETIKSLNRRQAHPLIHFHGDGSGVGILWSPTTENRLRPFAWFGRS